MLWFIEGKFHDQYSFPELISPEEWKEKNEYLSSTE
jgi:hypothetical protein